MALIVCVECGKDVSGNALSCPGCGSPINSPNRGVIGYVWIVVAIVLLGVISTVFYFRESFITVYSKPNNAELTKTATTEQKEQCIFVGKLAWSIMNARQLDFQTVEEAIEEYSVFNMQADEMVLDAYERPVYSGETFQSNTTREFAKKWYVKCLWEI